MPRHKVMRLRDEMLGSCVPPASIESMTERSSFTGSRITTILSSDDAFALHAPRTGLIAMAKGSRNSRQPGGGEKTPASDSGFPSNPQPARRKIEIRAALRRNGQPELASNPVECGQRALDVLFRQS